MKPRLKKIDKAALSAVEIRSPLTCQHSRGVCAKCYGRDLARGSMVNLGEVVGVIAAQSIGEPGTQLTMRTFHLGGAASSSVERSLHMASKPGSVRLKNVYFVENKDKEKVVMNRNGDLILVDDSGREVEKFKVSYGYVLKVSENDKVEKGQTLVAWDPYSNPIISEVFGRIKFENIKEGDTLSEQVNSLTGFTSKVITEGGTGKKPSIYLLDEDGEKITSAETNAPIRYVLPTGSQIMVSDGDQVMAGDILAKIDIEVSRTKDITGGLPRVAELFEARTPTNHSILADIDGVVSFGEDLKGKQRVFITSDDGEQSEYLVPKGKNIIVREGEVMRRGEPLVDGLINPHDILRIMGKKALASYLLNEVQGVYRLQGVTINDKHIEVIIRQMLKNVMIKSSGDTDFVVGSMISLRELEEQNKKVASEGGQPAEYDPMLLGITRVSLITDSWISAASFQETTKVLTGASIESKVDRLEGLKESIILGRLIPAGTGLGSYRERDVDVQDKENSPEGLGVGSSEGAFVGNPTSLGTQDRL